MLDLKVFEAADILGAPQSIKGFDKSDFHDIISIYLRLTYLMVN